MFSAVTKAGICLVVAAQLAYATGAENTFDNRGDDGWTDTIESRERQAKDDDADKLEALMRAREEEKHKDDDLATMPKWARDHWKHMEEIEANKFAAHPHSKGICEDLKAPEMWVAAFHTTKGDFNMTVTRSWAPHGVDRFYSAMKCDHYNGDKFFRVIPGFVVQFGLSGRPADDKKWARKAIPDDNKNQFSNQEGFVSFAHAGPGTRSAQVFINLANNGRLDSDNFVPIAKVDNSGMGVVKSLYAGYTKAKQEPDQMKIIAHGNDYLNKVYPKLDAIDYVEIIEPGSKPTPHDEQNQKDKETAAQAAMDAKRGDAEERYMKEGAGRRLLRMRRGVVQPTGENMENERMRRGY